jgi:phenylacetate-CoA ligase
MPGTDLRYWNPFLETLLPENLIEIELKNFRKYLKYAKENCVFYRQRYRDIDPEQIRSIEDVRKLPIIDKKDLRLAQEGKGAGLFGEILGVPPDDVTDFRQTSGTTGRPVYVAESYESWQWRVEVWCHLLWMAGFREHDTVFIPFGYNVYVAFWEGHYAAEKLGCMVVPGGALDTKGRINKMMEVKATGLLNTPTYGLHMAETATKMGIVPKDVGIKKDAVCRRTSSSGDPPKAGRYLGCRSL